MWNPLKDDPLAVPSREPSPAIRTLVFLGFIGFVVGGVWLVWQGFHGLLDGEYLLEIYSSGRHNARRSLVFRATYSGWAAFGFNLLHQLAGISLCCLGVFGWLGVKGFWRASKLPGWQVGLLLASFASLGVVGLVRHIPYWFDWFGS